MQGLRAATFLVLAAAAMLARPGAAHAAECAAPASALGVERIVEIDTAAGPIFGDMTHRVREPSFLGDKEVVLTFDDGPVPWITTSILDTLDRFCTKATFFSVGKMAVAYPRTTKEMVARGHTLGTHTWSHPNNLRRLSAEAANEQIEKGFAAVTLAAGEPIAPFFRFPGLSDSDTMLAHLQQRGIAAFTVDVVSNDSYIGSASRIASRVLAETKRRQGGILLFHDIKSATAKALPAILAGLKAEGFRIVHMVPKATMSPVADYDAELADLMSKSAQAKSTLLPFYGPVAAPRALDGSELPVTALAPAPRDRSPAAVPAVVPAGVMGLHPTPVKRARQKARRHTVDATN